MKFCEKIEDFSPEASSELSVFYKNSLEEKRLVQMLSKRQKMSVSKVLRINKQKDITPKNSIISQQ